MAEPGIRSGFVTRRLPARDRAIVLSGVAAAAALAWAYVLGQIVSMAKGTVSYGLLHSSVAGGRGVGIEVRIADPVQLNRGLDARLDKDFSFGLTG